MEKVSRAELKGKGQTVLGIIDPNQFGPTLMHEHILWDIRHPDWVKLDPIGYDITPPELFPINYGEFLAPGNLLVDDKELAKAEIQIMKEEGGQTVVDLSSGGLRPDPEGLAYIARETGTHIVMGCGHYVEEYQDKSNHDRTVESFAEEMIEQVFVGAWGTDIRAGIIGEIGCQTPWTDLEKRVMLGAIVAMKETGASLNIHPGREVDQPQEVADFLLKHDVDLSRVIISHIDRTIFDDEHLFRLADTGIVIEYDLFGQENSYYKWNEEIDMPNDAVRLQNVRRLIDRGHLDQITISQDICYRSRLRKFGGHGYGHIFRNVVPYMRRRNFSEAEIDTLIVGTPKRLLTFV